MKTTGKRFGGSCCLRSTLRFFNRLTIRQVTSVNSTPTTIEACTRPSLIKKTRKRVKVVEEKSTKGGLKTVAAECVCDRFRNSDFSGYRRRRRRVKCHAGPRVQIDWFPPSTATSRHAWPPRKYNVTTWGTPCTGKRDTYARVMDTCR